MAIPTNFTREQILAEIERRKKQEALQQKKRAKNPSKNTQNPTQSTRKPKPKQDTEKEKTPVKKENYLIDKKTGKKYKSLQGQNDAANAASSISALLAYGKIDDDIEADNLNSSAEIFLSHLRVPPDKKEMEELRRLKAEQRKKQNAEYSKLLEKDKEDNNNKE